MSTAHLITPSPKAYYICQTYNRLGKNACTSHKVEARDLYNLVLKDIQELAAMALKDVESFYQRIRSRMERRYLADASEMENALPSFGGGRVFFLSVHEKEAGFPTLRLLG